MFALVSVFIQLLLCLSSVDAGRIGAFRFRAFNNFGTNVFEPYDPLARRYDNSYIGKLTYFNGTMQSMQSPRAAKLQKILDRLPYSDKAIADGKWVVHMVVQQQSAATEDIETSDLYSADHTSGGASLQTHHKKVNCTDDAMHEVLEFEISEHTAAHMSMPDLLDEECVSTTWKDRQSWTQNAYSLMEKTTAADCADGQLPEAYLYRDLKATFTADQSTRTERRPEAECLENGDEEVLSFTAEASPEVFTEQYVLEEECNNNADASEIVYAFNTDERWEKSSRDNAVSVGSVVVDTAAQFPFFKNLTTTSSASMSSFSGTASHSLGQSISRKSTLAAERNSKEPAFTVTAWVKGHGQIMKIASGIGDLCGRMSAFSVDSSGQLRNDWGCSDTHASALRTTTTEWTHVAFRYDGYGKRSVVVGSQEEVDVQHDTSKDYIADTGGLVSATTHNAVIVRYNELGDVTGNFEGYSIRDCYEKALAFDHLYFKINNGVCQSSASKSGSGSIYRRSIQYMITEADFTGQVLHGPFSGQLDEVLVYDRYLSIETIVQIGAQLMMPNRFNGTSRIDHPLTGTSVSVKRSWTRYADFSEDNIERSDCYDSSDERYAKAIEHETYSYSGEGRGYGERISYTSHSGALENISSLSVTDSLTLCNQEHFDTKLVYHSYQETTHDQCMAQQVDEGACLGAGGMLPSTRNECTGVFYPARSYAWQPDNYELLYDVSEDDCTVGGDAWGQTQPLLFGAQGRNLNVFSDHEMTFYWRNKVGGETQVVNRTDLHSMKEWCRGTISCAGLQLDGAVIYPVEAVLAPQNDTAHGYRSCDERFRRPVESAMQCFLHAASATGPEGLIYISGDEFRSFTWGYEGSETGTACYEDAAVFKWTNTQVGTRLCSDEPSDYEFLPFEQSRWQRDNDSITSTKEDDCTLHKLDWKAHDYVYETRGTGSRPHFVLRGQKSWQREPVDCLYATDATFAINKSTARECRDEAILWGATGYSFQRVGSEFLYFTPRHFTHIEEARTECQRLHAHRDGPENAWDLCTNAQWNCAADDSCITSDTPDDTIFAVAACCFNTGTSCAITTNTDTCTPKHGYESFSFRACADEQVENTTNTTYNVYDPVWTRSEWRDETRSRTYDAAYYDIVQESGRCGHGMHLSYDECQVVHSDGIEPILHANNQQCSQGTRALGLFLLLADYLQYPDTYTVGGSYDILSYSECEHYIQTYGSGSFGECGSCYWDGGDTGCCRVGKAGTYIGNTYQYGGEFRGFHSPSYDNCKCNGIFQCIQISREGCPVNQYFTLLRNGPTCTPCPEGTFIDATNHQITTCGGPTLLTGKYLQEHTNGQGVVVPKEACEAFATAVSLPYTETDNAATPQGCYVDASLPVETVVFNSNTNTVPCSSTHRCVKIDDTKVESTPETYRDWCADACSAYMSFSVDTTNARCRCSERVDLCSLESSTGVSLYKHTLLSKTTLSTVPAWLGEVYDKDKIAGCAVEGTDMYYNRYRYDSAKQPETGDVALCKNAFEHFTETFDYNAKCRYLNHELEVSKASLLECQNYADQTGYTAFSFSDGRCLLANDRGPCEEDALWDSRFFVSPEAVEQFQRNPNKKFSILPVLECAGNTTAAPRVLQVPWGPEAYGVAWKLPVNATSYASEAEAKAACLSDCPAIYKDASGSYWALDRLESGLEMVPTDPSYVLHRHRLRNVDNFNNRRLVTIFPSASKEDCHAECLLETSCRMVQYAYGQCMFFEDIYETLTTEKLSYVLYEEVKGAVSYGPSGDCWLYKNKPGQRFSDASDGDCRSILTNGSGYKTFPVDKRLAGENKVVYILTEPDLSQAAIASNILHEERSEAWCNDRDGQGTWTAYPAVVSEKEHDDCSGTWTRNAAIERQNVLQRECELPDSKASSWTRNSDAVTATKGKGGYALNYQNGYALRLGSGCGTLDLEETDKIYGQACLNATLCSEADRGHGYAVIDGACFSYLHEAGGNASDCRWERSIANASSFLPLVRSNFPDSVEACNARATCEGICERLEAGARAFVLATSGVAATPTCHAGWAGEDCTTLSPSYNTDESITDKRHSAIDYCERQGQRLCPKQTPFPVGNLLIQVAPQSACVHYEAQTECTIEDYSAIEAVASCCGRTEKSGKMLVEAVFYERVKDIGPCSYPKGLSGSMMVDSTEKLVDSYSVQQIAKALCAGGDVASGDCEAACLADSSCNYFSNSSTTCTLHSTCTQVDHFDETASTFRLRRKAGLSDKPQQRHELIGDCKYHATVRAAAVIEQVPFEEATDELVPWRCERGSVVLDRNISFLRHSLNESFKYDVMEEHSIDDNTSISLSYESVRYTDSVHNTLEGCLDSNEGLVNAYDSVSKRCRTFQDPASALRTEAAFLGQSFRSAGLFEEFRMATDEPFEVLQSSTAALPVADWALSSAADDCEVFCLQNNCDGYVLSGQDCKLVSMPNSTMLAYMRAVEAAGSVIVRLRTSSELVCRPNASAWQITQFEAASMPSLAVTELLGTASTLQYCKHLFFGDKRTPRLDVFLYDSSTGECRISLLRDTLVASEGASTVAGFSAYRIAVAAMNPWRTEATKYETEDIARETCLPPEGMLAGRDCLSHECAAFWFREEDVIRHEITREQCNPMLPPELPLLSFAWDRNRQGTLTFNVEEDTCRESQKFLSWRTGTEGRERIVVESEAECMNKSTADLTAVFLGNEPLPDHRSACNGIVDEHSFERLFPHAIQMAHSESTRIVSTQASIDECAAHANAYYAHQNRSTESKVFEYRFTDLQCAIFSEIECPTLCLPDDTVKQGFSAFRLHGETGLTAASCWLLSVLDSQSTGRTYCRQCPLGKHSARAGSNCLPCQQGRYADEEGLRACKSCPEGTFQFGSGETHCHNCPAGSYQDISEGKRSCKLCAAGKYEQNNTCHDCPAGTAAPNNFESNNAGDLVYSGTNYKGPLLYYDPRFDYSDVHGISYKEADGTYMKGYSPIFTALRKLQMDQHDSPADCISCTAGTYADQSGASECKACAEGQFNAAVGATDCTECNIGKVARPSNASFHELMPFACFSAEELGEYKSYNSATDAYDKTGEDIGLIREEAQTHLEDCFESCKAEQACLFVSYKASTCRLHRKCDERGETGWAAYRMSRSTSSISDSTSYALSIEATVYGPSHHECKEESLLVAPETYVHFPDNGISTAGTIATAFTFQDAIDQCNSRRDCVGFTYAGAEDVSLRTFEENAPILLKNQGDKFGQTGLQAWFKEPPVETKKDCQQQCAQLTNCTFMEWNGTKACRKWSSCTPVKKASLEAPESSLYQIGLSASYRLFPFQGRWPCDAVVLSGKTKEECEAEAVATTAPMFYFDDGACHVYVSYTSNGIDDLYSGLATRQSSICLSGSAPPAFETATGFLYVLGKRAWDEAAVQCFFCPAGLHTEVATATVCRQCQAGTYDINPQSSNPCQACELGRFQDEPGQATCKACSAGRYQDEVGGEQCKASGQGYRAVGQGLNIAGAQDTALWAKTSGPLQTNTNAQAATLDFEGATGKEICGRNSFAAGYENMHCKKVPVGAISVTRERLWTKEQVACLYEKNTAVVYVNVSASLSFYEGDLFNRGNLKSVDDCIAFANEQSTGATARAIAVSFGGGFCHFFSNTADGVTPKCIVTDAHESASISVGETQYASQADEPSIDPEWFENWTPHEGVRFVGPYECTGINYAYVGDYYSVSDCINICRQSRNNGVAACRYISYSSNDNKCYLVNWEVGLTPETDGSGQSGKIFQTTVSNVEEACSYGSRTVTRNSGDTEVGSGGYRVKDHVPGADVGHFTEYSITGEGTSFGETMKIIGRKDSNGGLSVGMGGYYQTGVPNIIDERMSASLTVQGINGCNPGNTYCPDPIYPFCSNTNTDTLSTGIDLGLGTIDSSYGYMYITLPQYVFETQTSRGGQTVTYKILHLAWPSKLTCNGEIWSWDADGNKITTGTDQTTGLGATDIFWRPSSTATEYKGYAAFTTFELQFQTNQRQAIECQVDSFHQTRVLNVSWSDMEKLKNVYSDIYLSVFLGDGFAESNILLQDPYTFGQAHDPYSSYIFDTSSNCRGSNKLLFFIHGHEDPGVETSEWHIDECKDPQFETDRCINLEYCTYRTYRTEFSSACRWGRRRFYDRMKTVLLQQHTLATNVFPDYKIDGGYQADNLLHTLGFYDIHDLNEENGTKNGPLEFTYKRVNHISYNHSSIMPLFDVGMNEDNFDTTDTSMANFRAVKGGNTFEYCSGSTTQPAAPYYPASCDDLGYPFIIDQLESASSSKKVCVKVGSLPLEKCCIGSECDSSIPSCMNVTGSSGLASVPYTVLQYLSFDESAAAVLSEHSDNNAARGLAYVKDKCSQRGNACLGVSSNVADDFFYTHAPSLALKIKINTDRDFVLKTADYKEEGLATIENATKEEGADTLRACYEICLQTRLCTMFSFRPSDSGCFVQRDLFASVIDSGTEVLFTLNKNVDDTSKAQFCRPCAIGSTASSATQGGIGVCKACEPGKISSTSNIFVAEEQVGLAAQEDCQACPVGMLYLAATASCIACPKGFACAREESYFGSAVAQCKKHEYSTSSLLDFEGEGVSSSASLRCDYCVAGKYNNMKGAEYCEKCPKGFYSNIRQSCEPCPVGTYTLTTASDECFEVDSQSYIAWPASTLSAKRLCSTGNCAVGESRTCIGTEDAYCQSCPELRPGHRTYAIGSECVIEKCQPGTFSANGCLGSSCCTDCTSNCKAGQHSVGCGDPDDLIGGHTQNTQCADCPVNTYTEFDALDAPCDEGAGPNFGSQGTCAKCDEAPHILGEGFTTASPWSYLDAYERISPTPETHTDQRRCAAGTENAGNLPSNNNRNSFLTDPQKKCCSAAAYKCIDCRSTELVSYSYSASGGIWSYNTLFFGRTEQPAWSTDGLTGQTYCQSYWYLWNKAARDAVVAHDARYAPVYGCTDSDANNYNSGATKSDGSCTYDDCFPSEAIVETPEGKKPIYALEIGDFALSHEGFSEVYLLGHADNESVAEYLHLTTDNGTSIRLSKEHFIESNGRYVYAKDVKKGDRLAYGERVIGIEKEKAKGLWNPFTIAGTIVVDGVLASCHSDWFLENLPEWMRPSRHLIPAIYQALMAPARQIYRRNRAWVRRFVDSFEGKAIGEHSLTDVLKKMWSSYGRENVSGDH